ncbi:MAG: DNA-binding protein [Sphingobacteriales bacterium]|nr:MAG: DNA-binding protein [Sphingobacteriales bacterium]
MNKIDTLIETLYKIYLLLKDNPNFQQIQQLQPEELMTRQEVKDYLGISESTYKRKVKDGSLIPLKLPGGDRFQRTQLLLAFEESRRRGRV